MAWSKTTKGKSVLLQETVTIADSGGANATYIPTSIIPVVEYLCSSLSIRLKSGKCL